MRRPTPTASSSARAALAVAIVLGVATLAGCGGSDAGASSTTGAATSSTTTTTGHAGPVAFDIVGTVTDPGPTPSDIAPAASLSRFTLTGGSHWEGGLQGDTTYTGPGVIDPSTGDSDVSLHETFTGSLPELGAGTLECDDFLHNEADGSGSVELWVVEGSGALSGLEGHLRFTWTGTNPDGSITGGEFHGVLYRE